MGVAGCGTLNHADRHKEDVTSPLLWGPSPSVEGAKAAECHYQPLSKSPTVLITEGEEAASLSTPQKDVIETPRQRRGAGRPVPRHCSECKLSFEANAAIKPNMCYMFPFTLRIVTAPAA